MTTFYTLTFNTGGGNNGGHQLYPGDIIWESSHTLSALVIAVNTTSGTWAGGNAAGTLTMQVIYGSWTASQYFDASCAGANTAYIVSLAALQYPPATPGPDLDAHGLTCELYPVPHLNPGQAIPDGQDVFRHPGVRPEHCRGTDK